jgi:hypothetical protein
VIASGRWHRARTGRVCALAGWLAAEVAAGCRHPALGVALAAVDVIVPALIALVLLAAILCGSTETCERAFRLLRWIAGRPEPLAPASRVSGRGAVPGLAGPDRQNGERRRGRG